MVGDQRTKIIQIFEEAMHVAANRTQSTLRHLLNQEVTIETPTVRYTESTLIDAEPGAFLLSVDFDQDLDKASGVISLPENMGRDIFVMMMADHPVPEDDPDYADYVDDSCKEISNIIFNHQSRTLFLLKNKN